KDGSLLSPRASVSPSTPMTEPTRLACSEARMRRCTKLSRPDATDSASPPTVVLPRPLPLSLEAAAFPAGCGNFLRLRQRTCQVAQGLTRVLVDRRAMRYEDALQRIDFGPLHQLSVQRACILDHHHFHHSGDLRFFAGEACKLQQPAA